MDSADPMYWLIMGLALLIAVLALREPWDGDPWRDDADRPPDPPPRRSEAEPGERP